MVPRWVRGEESLELISTRREALPVPGLGPTVATPPEGIQGEMLVVESFQELEERASEAQGRIVQG
jgi:carboxypeptidase Q